jgi:predicted DNA-binding protein (MmcQ/YjbR family)
MKSKGGTIEDQVREFTLGFPGAYEEFPWGHSAIKVKGKSFAFFGTDEAGVFSISVKLPQSRDVAVDLPFTEPTGYGLGKSGWVTATLKQKKPPLDLLRAWITESYRAIAPNKLVKELDGTA